MIFYCAGEYATARAASAAGTIMVLVFLCLYAPSYKTFLHMHSIKSSHVDICGDVLETNKTK